VFVIAPKNTTTLCFYILQGRVILAEEKIRFESLEVKVKLSLWFGHANMKEYGSFTNF